MTDHPPTDDLTRRARNMAAATTWPELSALVSELADALVVLADEVERLTSANVTLRTVRDRLSADVARLTAERDEARAALANRIEATS